MYSMNIFTYVPKN